MLREARRERAGLEKEVAERLSNRKVSEASLS